MSRKPAIDPRSDAIDPRSDAIVLFYIGGPPPGDVPARDVHGGDLARIVYVRAHLDLDGGTPAPATSGQLEALFAELSASGAFTTDEPTPEAPVPPAEPEV